MESALALLGYETHVREHHSQGLLWFKAIAALRRADLPLAKKLSTHLTTTKTSIGGVYGHKAYEHELRFESALQRRDANALRSALANLKTVDTLFDRGPSCSYAFRSAQSIQSRGELASATTAFSDIVDGKCRPGAGHAYVVAESRIQLIGVYLGQQMPTKAQDVFKRFRHNWPNADSWLTASRRMKEFQDLIPK